MGKALLLLISSGVVLLFLLWSGPLILQLAPVGTFQPQPLFLCCTMAHICALLHKMLCVSDAELHFNSVERHNQSWPHFTLSESQHTELLSGWVGGRCRTFSFLAGKVSFYSLCLFSLCFFLTFFISPSSTCCISYSSFLFLVRSLAAFFQSVLGDRLRRS